MPVNQGSILNSMVASSLMRAFMVDNAIMKEKITGPLFRLLSLYIYMFRINPVKKKIFRNRKEKKKYLISQQCVVGSSGAVNKGFISYCRSPKPSDTILSYQVYRKLEQLNRLSVVLD